ncbi:DNA cytosine methyltransferase [Phyllobacterium sp. CL33Tsu]|uniref:DNA cytosine methyltransferase n=1 Tax=Phyllobacterium sp. CL33Tsu TaxID=1798191 RepID=UPI001FCE192D|nr:DNA cytosine methyltransferase [Phyllobacterium sp. CL33Tsu]
MPASTQLTGSEVSGSVVDLFCGAGGLTHGFRLEGFDVAAGIDIDPACRYPYEENNDARFLERDVGAVDAAELNGLFQAGQPKILVGCAPCQPFSSYNQKNDDPKWRLVEKFADLILSLRPHVISMENVPRLMNFRGGGVFADFVQTLEDAGYKVFHKIVYAPDFGIPQSRSRLVMLASRLGPIQLINPTHAPESYVSVQDVIGSLPELAAGMIDAKDPLHRASRLSDINMKRIRASKPGGTWRDWDDNLIAKCHQATTGDGYVSVYGRMKHDEPSPTITTQFFGFGNGRFGHPSQDRALSLREGAILQSFPREYKFVRPTDVVNFKGLGRMIGNAVPVLLGRAIAQSIKIHLGQYPATDL